MLVLISDVKWLMSFVSIVSFVIEGLDSIRAGYAEPTTAVQDDEDVITKLSHDCRRGEAGQDRENVGWITAFQFWFGGSRSVVRV